MALFGQGQNQQINPLLAQMEADRKRRMTGQQVGLVRGRHLIDWVPTYQQWLREGRENEALDLLLEIIEAAAQLSKIDGVAPPSGYIQQATAIYQRHGDEAGELAVLERYAAACPPGKGDPALLGRLKQLGTD
jgi:hypothetical protein